MTFVFDFPLIVLILLAVNLLIVIYIATFHRSFISKVKNIKSDNETDSLVPPVSVIVYCRDNAERLAKLLPQILKQNYAADFEVILINDGGSEDTKDVFNYLSLTHKNLYQTFIPQCADNISPKKLAITLGVKAAQYDYVVFTNADAIIESDKWLSSFGTEFAKGKDVVIGNSVPNNKCKKILGQFKCFDMLADRITTFSSALFGRLYRCSTYNMGYRKSLFFDSKGFSRYLNLNYGDDDIFVRLFANADNSAIILSNESLVSCDYTMPTKYHSIMKQRNIYTRHLTSPFGRNIMAFGSLITWIWLIITGITVWISLPNLIPAIALFFIAIPFWWTTIYAWKKAAKILNIHVSAWLMPLFILYRPFYNFLYRIKTHNNRRQFFVLR